MTTAPPTPHIRPYWHVDAKWVCGIIFGLLLWLALVTYSLVALTEEKVAVPIATQIVASMFSRNGLDDPTDIIEFKKKAAEQPGDFVEALPGTKISKADLNTLTPREIRMKIFSQLVTPYYTLGVKGAVAAQTSDPEQQAKAEQQAGLLSLLSKETHNKLITAWLVVGLLALLPLVGLVWFSSRFGRLASPGLVMAWVALPGTIMTLVVASAQSNQKPGAGAVPNLPPETVAQIAKTLQPGFLLIFGVGIFLLLAALVGKLVWGRKPA